MCIGRSPSPPPAPPRMKPAPPPAPSKPPAAPPPNVEKVDDEATEKQKLSTRKKKALEIKKTREGVRNLGAIDPAAELNPNANVAPPSGINTPM